MSDLEHQPSTQESLLSHPHTEAAHEHACSHIKFDPYQCPADLEVAKAHGKAKHVFRFSSNIHNALQNKETCPCCGLPKEGELIPLRAQLREFYHLGSGYALYFKLTRYCVALLILMFLVSGLFNLWSNGAAGDCPESSDDELDNSLCVQSFVLKFTIANKKDHPELLTAQMVLTLISILVIMVFTQFMRYQLRKVHIEVDDLTVTPADYTVGIQGIEPEMTNEQIKEWLEALSTPENPVKCRKIHRTHDVGEYIELEKKKHSLHTHQMQIHDEEKKKELESEINKLTEEMHELREGGLKMTSNVLVTFDKAHHAAYIIEQFNKAKIGGGLYYHFLAFIGASSHVFNGKRVYIERAPEPTDILWENLGCSPWEKFRKRSMTKVIAAGMILTTFGLIAAINWGQTAAATSTSLSSNLVSFFGWLASILIVVINFLLGRVTEKLADQEKHSSYTSFFTGIASKLSGAQIVNTAFTTLLAQVLVFNNFKKDPSLEGGISAVSFYGAGGLLEDMFYVFITNAVLTPVFDFFDVFYIVKLCKRFFAERKGGRAKLTQQEAHTLYEEPSMDIALNHSLLLATMLAIGFFSPALPSALVIGIIGLYGNFWMDKYLFLRRNVLPISLQNEICDTMMDSLEWMGAMIGFGNLLFLVTLPNSEGIYLYNVVPKGLTYTIVVFGLLGALLPTKLINERLFHIVDEVTEVHTYDAIKAEFPTDYKIENPVTSKEGKHDQAVTLERKKIMIPKIRKNLMLGASLLKTEKKFINILKNKRNLKAAKAQENQQTAEEVNGNINQEIPEDSLNINEPQEVVENKTLLPKKKFNLKNMISSGIKNEIPSTTTSSFDDNSQTFIRHYS